MRLFACIAALFLFVAPAFALDPGEALQDPALEARARAISAQLRCLVCQNQSIDDSEASLAKDLRLLVRERLKAGDSDARVKEYLVARYGDFILLKPPLKAATIVLWTAPFALLLIGAATLAFAARRRARPEAVADLSDEERARLREIIET